MHSTILQVATADEDSVSITLISVLLLETQKLLLLPWIRQELGSNQRALFGCIFKELKRVLDTVAKRLHRHFPDGRLL